MSFLSPQLIIDVLSPHVSAVRQRRIHRTVSQRLFGVTVLLEAPYDPHNAAAVFRTAEALGILNVHVVPDASGFQFSKRVSSAADKWINIHIHESISAAIDHLSAQGFELHAACLPTEQDSTLIERFSTHLQMHPIRPIAILFGNEHRGLSSEAIARATRLFSLPMLGFVESYNLSVAAALVLSACTRQRRVALGACGDLPADCCRRLRALYLSKSVRGAPEIIMRGLLSDITG